MGESPDEREAPPLLFMCRGCWYGHFPTPCRPEPWRCGRHGGTVATYAIQIHKPKGSTDD